MLRIMLVAIFVLLPQIARADCQEQAVRIAEQLCREVRSMGQSRTITASGELSAETRGLLRGLLSGSADIDGSVVLDEYENVLRTDLPALLQSQIACRERMFLAASERGCRKTANTCRDPAFGLEKWRSTERIVDSTGWRSGWTQPAWCEEAKRRAIAARVTPGTPYEVAILRSWENAKWDNPTFRIGRKYRYHCELEIKWNPLYRAKQDPICGFD